MSFPKKLPTLLLCTAMFALTVRAQDYSNDKPTTAPSTTTAPLTDEQKTALRAIDVRLAGVESLAEKIDDASYKKSTASAIADLKRRRKALERNFEAALYESLMHSVISRYQLTALWLTPPRVLPPPKSAAQTANK